MEAAIFPGAFVQGVPDLYNLTIHYILMVLGVASIGSMLAHVIVNQSLHLKEIIKGQLITSTSIHQKNAKPTKMRLGHFFSLVTYYTTYTEDNMKFDHFKCLQTIKILLTNNKKKSK